MTLTDAEIADLRALLEKAAPRPWKQTALGYVDAVGFPLTPFGVTSLVGIVAVNALPALLDDLEATKRALQEVAAERDALKAVLVMQEALMGERDAALAQVVALRDGLQDLFDEQNGPPLYLDREDWQAAHDNAIDLLTFPAPAVARIEARLRAADALAERLRQPGRPHEYHRDIHRSDCRACELLREHDAATRGEEVS